jgi:hypothetical protein
VADCRFPKLDFQLDFRLRNENKAPSFSYQSIGNRMV